MEESLVERLKIRASIRRQIPSRKSVQEGKPDRLSDLLEEAAAEISRLECIAYDNTNLQIFLDIHVMMSNALEKPDLKNNIKEVIKFTQGYIEQIRGPAPPCYGEDDCSTDVLSRCPWRMSCGH